MTAVFGLALLAFLAAAAFRGLRCRHRYGVPLRGTVCCLRCARRFPILETNGEFRIGKQPVRD